MTRPYPAGLLLEGRPCLVAGAGRVAERKVEGLLAAGARIHVVAPRATPAIEALAADGRIEWSARPAGPADLEGAALALICTDDRAVNQRLAAEARRRGILANVADAPEEGTLLSPALVERGELLAAVWSGGGPVVSQAARDRIAAALGEEWAALSRAVARCRAEVNRGLPPAARAAFWRRAIDNALATLLRGEDEAAAEAAIRTAAATPAPARADDDQAGGAT